MKRVSIVSIIVLFLFSVIFLSHKEEYKFSLIIFPIISLFFLFLGIGLIYLIEKILEPKERFRTESWVIYLFSIIIAFAFNCIFAFVLINHNFDKYTYNYQIIILQLITLILHFLLFALTKIFEEAKQID
ncbi:MAG: hypothetical protein WCO35_01425 [Candidatus Nomurabacteria bacterium]